MRRRIAALEVSIRCAFVRMAVLIGGLTTLLMPRGHAWAQEQPPDEPAAPAPTDPPAQQEPEPDVLGALGTVFDATPGWAWFALFGGILGGLIAGKIVQVALRRVADRMRAYAAVARAVIFDGLAGPASLALLTVGIHLGLVGVVMPPEIALFVFNVLKFLYLLAIGGLIYTRVNLIDIALKRHIEKSHSKLAAQIAPLVRKAIRIFVIIIFVLFIAQNVFGINVTAWLAGLGIAGLAVSLAAQDSIKNLFGSITVLLDKPFAVGDRIVFGDADGFVEEIGFRSTKIRTFTGHLVTVPNMKFIDSNVENVSARPFLRRTLDVTITYDTPPEKVEQAVQIIKDILFEAEMVDPFRLEERPPRVFFNDYNAASLNISVSYWYFLDEPTGRDWWGFLAYNEKFNHLLFKAFGEAGIDFAFPTQTLYLAGDPDRELAVRVLGDSTVAKK
jgi:MscS family membrane protein